MHAREREATADRRGAARIARETSRDFLAKRARITRRVIRGMLSPRPERAGEK